jgi:hypothetical protein
VKGAALMVLLILAGCVGAITALATDANPTLIAVQAISAVLVMEGFRRLDLPRTRLFAAGELVALIAVAGVGFLAGQRNDALTGLAISLVIWLLAAITAADLSAVAEPTDLVEGIGGATRRLNGRFLLVGSGLALLVVAGYGGFGLSANARPQTNDLVWPFLLYWVVGLFALSAVHRQRLLGRWQRDGARLDQDLTVRWRQVVVISISLLVLGGLGWWWGGRPVLTATHTAIAWIVRSGGDALARLQGQETPAPEQNGEPVEMPPLPEAVNPVQPASEIWDAILIALVALLFGGVFMLYGKRRGRAKGWFGRSWLRGLGQIVLALLGVAKAIGQWLRRIRWRRSGTVRVGGSGREPASRPVLWTPTDPVRRRIANAFREQVAIASQKVSTPGVGETPIEYSGRVGPDPRFGDLAHLYGEARYSTHLLSEEVALRAEDLSRALSDVWGGRAAR